MCLIFKSRAKAHPYHNAQLLAWLELESIDISQYIRLLNQNLVIGIYSNQKQRMGWHQLRVPV